MKIAIAGASGFVGRALVEELKTHHDIIGLSRSDKKSDSDSLIWKSCDLFSLLDAERSLDGVDVAIYLVHSMRPSARLTQGTFEDFDLIVADNFVRAAKKAGVKHLIYLGGLYPEHAHLASSHLESRHEVEDLFKAGEVPYTILRAPIIIGADGSSFHIMTRLVERLPMMVCPSWTSSRTQPIALKDVVASIKFCVETPETQNRIFDLGGPDTVTYLEMMLMIARLLDLKRSLFPVPLLTPGISTLWVCLITGAPRELVRPLIDGLRVNLLVSPDRSLEMPGYQKTSLEEALKLALKDYDPHHSPLAFKKVIHNDSAVRSVQRLELPMGKTADDVAKAYMKFLPRTGPGFLKVTVEGRKIQFCWKYPFTPLLVLEYSEDRSWPHRQLFYVKGGLLAQETKRGRLEFREVLGGKAIIAAIHEFKPRIPWFIYRWTQALFHVRVMKQFGGYLRRTSKTR